MSFGLSNITVGITLLNVSSALWISIYSLIQRVVIIEGDLFHVSYNLEEIMDICVYCHLNYSSDLATEISLLWACWSFVVRMKLIMTFQQETREIWQPSNLDFAAFHSYSYLLIYVLTKFLTRFFLVKILNWYAPLMIMILKIPCLVKIRKII